MDFADDGTPAAVIHGAGGQVVYAVLVPRVPRLGDVIDLYVAKRRLRITRIPLGDIQHFEFWQDPAGTVARLMRRD